jgi:hypothetical protein
MFRGAIVGVPWVKVNSTSGQLRNASTVFMDVGGSMVGGGKVGG